MHSFISRLTGLVAVFSILGSIVNSGAQGTAFSYQGRLTTNGMPASGVFDFQFTLLAVNPPLSLTLTQPLVVHDVLVSNGLFTARIDFGAETSDGFDGSTNRFLQIAVRLGDSSGGFTELMPHQPISAAPYAIYAAGVNAIGINGTIPAKSLSGTYSNSVRFTNALNSFAGNGGGLSDVNATLLGGLDSTAFWSVAGNAGTTAGTHFVGTSDDEPLEFKVNNKRALRLSSPGAGVEVNVLAGSSQNIINATGATIAGGGSVINSSTTNANIIFSDYGSIGGGIGNQIAAVATASTVSGGSNNWIGRWGFGVDGAVGATIAGGARNALGTSADYASIGGGFSNIIATSADYAAIVGGFQNRIGTNAATAAIGGGDKNQIAASSEGAIIAGGVSNDIGSNSIRSVIGGGFNNEIAANAPYGTVPGGQANYATNYAFAAGRRAKANHTGAFVWADSQNADFASTGANQFLIRASGGVGINKTNPATALDVNGTVTATNFSGPGANLTSLNANNISSGTVVEARIDSAIARDSEIIPAVLANDGPGSGLNADQLDGFDSSQFWKIGGNASTTPGIDFLGTTDNQALELKVNNVRAIRIEPNGAMPNILGGSPANFISPGVPGATIAGGGDSAGEASLARVLSPGASVGFTVSDGLSNRLASFAATISGGLAHSIGSNSSHSVISGGAANRIGTYSANSVIAGGAENQIQNTNGGLSVIGGGSRNVAGTNSVAVVIAGGQQNATQFGADFATISGGSQHRANGRYSAIPGGEANAATNYAFAAGRRAKANHEGAFVWADSQNVDFASTAANQFLIRAAGGVGIQKTNPAAELDVNGTIAAASIGLGTASPAAKLHVAANTSNAGNNTAVFSATSIGPWHSHVHFGTTGDWLIRSASPSGKVILQDNGGNVGIGTVDPANKLHVAGNIYATGTITPNSDRNAKTDIESVDSAAILERVAALPIRQWRFKSEEEGVKHVGPMAQDFHAAFGLGAHETAIATVDADGVALAAIQGLNRKLEEKLQEKETELAELKKSVAELKALVQALMPLPSAGNKPGRQ